MHAALSVKDSAFAAAFAAALPPDPLQGDLLGQSVPAWAARDLAAALAWARALPDGTAKQSALLHLLPAWEKADLDGLLEFAATLPPEYSQFQAVIAGRLAGRDPEGALLWAGLLQPGRSRDQAVTNAAAIWASASPGDAAGFFAALPAGEMQQAGALVAVSAWAAQDLVAAAQWVADLRDGKLKRLAGDRLAFWEAKEAAGGISLLAGRRESKVTPPLSPAPTGSRRFPTNE